MRSEDLSLRKEDKLLRVGFHWTCEIGARITPRNRCVMVGVFHRLRSTQPTGLVLSFYV